jgi:hypothetical protein
MEAIASNTPRVPFAMPLVLSLGIMLLVAAFLVRLRVVILKWKHSQPHSDKQSDKPEKRGGSTPTLVLHSHASGE